MGNPVSPEKRRYRPFFIVCVAAQGVVLPVAVAGVLAVTADVRLVVPLLLLGYASMERMDRLMVWLSTPAELKSLPPPGQGQFVSFLRAWLLGERPPPPEDGKPGRSGL